MNGAMISDGKQTDPAPGADAESEPARLARLALFAFVITFIIARIMVLLIMERRVPNLYFFMRGTHVHHLNYGIFLLAGVGAFLLLRLPSGKSLRGGALAYGIALALTFDEFGMWLHLGGSYWQRASVDAIIVVAAMLALLGYASAIRSFRARHVRASIALLVALIAFGAVLYDGSMTIGKIEGPRLEALEASSSP